MSKNSNMIIQSHYEFIIIFECHLSFLYILLINRENLKKFIRIFLILNILLFYPYFKDSNIDLLSR